MLVFCRVHCKALLHRLCFPEFVENIPEPWTKRIADSDTTHRATGERTATMRTKRDICPTCSPDRKRALFDESGSAAKPTWTCRCCKNTKPRRIMSAARAQRAADFRALCSRLSIETSL
jgi:hypothetical protein